MLAPISLAALLRSPAVVSMMDGSLEKLVRSKVFGKAPKQRRYELGLKAGEILKHRNHLD